MLVKPLLVKPLLVISVFFKYCHYYSGLAFMTVFYWGLPPWELKFMAPWWMQMLFVEWSLIVGWSSMCYPYINLIPKVYLYEPPNKRSQWLLSYLILIWLFGHVVVNILDSPRPTDPQSLVIDFQRVLSIYFLGWPIFNHFRSLKSKTDII